MAMSAVMQSIPTAEPCPCRICATSVARLPVSSMAEDCQSQKEVTAPAPAPNPAPQPSPPLAPKVMNKKNRLG